MKFYDSTKGEEVEATWSDHQPGCEKCREIDLSRSATFARVCAIGGGLLTEELAKRQAPVEKAKRAAALKWAEEAGTFIKSRAAKVRTPYVGE